MEFLQDNGIKRNKMFLSLESIAIRITDSSTTTCFSNLKSLAKFKRPHAESQSIFNTKGGPEKEKDTCVL